MTVPQENPPQEAVQPKQNNAEFNFRALEAKYEKKLAEERQARLELEQKLSNSVKEDEEDDSEPYVDRKKLHKTLAKFGKETKTETQSEINKAVHSAIYEERKQNWLKSNSDFYDVMQNAQKFADEQPEMAEAILEMPDNFERQKLVYKNIKALGLHKPKSTEPSIQQKIDANKRSPYYQPSGIATAPYSSQGDFSASGQKRAYEKLQELKNNLRI